MKKKIILFIFVISLFIVILSLSAFADNSEYYGLTIQNGTTIVLNNNITYISTSTTQTININYRSNNTNFTIMQFAYNKGIRYKNSSYDTSVWEDASGWANQVFRTIIFNQDYTLQENDYFTEYLLANAISGLPEPPPPPPPDPMDTVYNDGQTFLSNTSTNLNTILSFIVTNPVITIFTIGIFLISITVGILYRLNNKTTRKKS